MKTFVLLLLLLHGAAAVTRSLKFFKTLSSGVTNLPEFLGVGQVDGVEMMRYNSNTRKIEPKQDWMEKLTADDPEILERETQNFRRNQQISKDYLETAKQRFNQTGGVHMLQRMYGCEWDDQTGEINGFQRTAYDGEDFLSFDLKTQTCVAAKPEAVAFKHEWDNDKARLEYVNHYFSQECVESLKKLLNYGRSFLLRTELPSVFLLQKTPSSPVSCFATGFFPDRAMMFWRKDGEELHEDEEIGELLPNHDGTFQMSVDLTLPEDAKDLHKYECVFHLAGVKEDLVYRLDRSSIKTNHRNPLDATTTIIIVVVLLALVLLASIAVVLYKKKKASGSGSEINSAPKQKRFHNSCSSVNHQLPEMKSQKTPKQIN